MKERVRDGVNAQLLKVGHREETPSLQERSNWRAAKEIFRLVIPKPGLSARNLLSAGSETTDSSRYKPRFGMTMHWGFSTGNIRWVLTSLRSTCNSLEFFGQSGEE